MACASRRAPSRHLAYGGDFGDDPNDGNFVITGCFSRTGARRRRWPR